MLKCLSQHIGFPLIDLMMGTNRLKDLRDYERSQWYSAAELENLQNEKLARLVDHAYRTVPYYSDIMRQHKLKPDDIRTVGDLQKLPILTRQIAQREKDRLVSTVARRKNLVIKSTGGSTGEPLVFLIEREYIGISAAALCRALTWIGWTPGDPIATLWGQPVAQSRFRRIRKRTSQWLTNVVSMDSFKLSDEQLREYAGRLLALQPAVLRGYVSSLVRLARYLERHGIESVHPNGISTTAEVLHQVDRDLLGRQFGCRVFDQYGCCEVLAVAAECAAHTGMHVNSERVVLEVIRAGEPSDPGVDGEVVLTDLDKLAMPFIRYANGDRARFAGQLCPCGRKLPLLSQVLGRVVDIIVGPSGKAVHGEFFTHLLQEEGWFSTYGVREFQAIQSAPSKLAVDVVCEQQPSSDAIMELTRRIQSYLGLMEISVNQCSAIDRGPSGKYRFTRSDCPASSSA